MDNCAEHRNGLSGRFIGSSVCKLGLAVILFAVMFAFGASRVFAETVGAETQLHVPAVHEEAVHTCGVCGKHLVVDGLDLSVDFDKPLVVNGGGLRYAEILLVLDDAFIELHGEEAEADAVAMFNRAAQLYANSFSGVLQLELVGIISYPREVPAGITVNDAGNGEVVTMDLLNSFSQWQNSNSSDIETMLGHSYDAAVLMSGHDFYSSTVGLAWIGGMCMAQYRTSVVQSSWSNTYTGNILAHELGHTLGMEHDGSGNSCDPISFVMAASGNPSSPAETFSTCSIAYYQNWLNQGFGSCLLNVPVGAGWSVGRCGDGRLDADEDCDAGIDLFDGSCCDSSGCYLEPGCGCANYGACCDNGVVSAAGSLCRATTGECDVAEFCDGVSGMCPRDLGAAQGTDCTSANGFDGNCYDGECASAGEICYEYVDMYGFDAGGYANSCDGRVRCYRSTEPGVVYTLTGGLDTTGVECSEGMQCHDEMCVDSASIGPFGWAVGLWSECVSGVQTRAVTCIDIAGTAVDDSHCDVGSKPSTNHACTTFTLADFAVMQRCMDTPANGECAVLDLTSNSYVNLADYSLFADLLVGP